MPSVSWYSWIPTNLGELNFNFIGKSKIIQDKYNKIRKTGSSFYIKKLDISSISDTYISDETWLDFFLALLLPTLEDEKFGYVDLLLIKSLASFEGKIRLSYPGHVIANAHISINLNGLLKISDLSIDSDDEELWSEFDDKNDFMNYLAQVIFIVIKGLIHGDNHHHQKIDTAITVNQNSFRPELIIKSMIQHIKRVEHDIKNLDRCYGEIKAKNSIEEMKGYRSYINTFRILFSDKMILLNTSPTYIKDPKILDNVIDSLESNVKKSQNKPAHRLSLISTILVYLAALISGAILYVNLFGDQKQTIVGHWGYYWIYAVIIFYLGSMHLKCIIQSLVFYQYYHLYEYLFHLEAIEKPRGIKRFLQLVLKQRYTLFTLLITLTIFYIKNKFFI